MAAEIMFKIASQEHALMQPFHKRYALFCWAYMNGHAPECHSIKREGFLGNFSTFEEIKQVADVHEHSTLIKFFPIYFQKEPSDAFKAAYAVAKQDGKVLS